MLNKNISEFFGFVISLTSICLISTSCFLVSSNNKQSNTNNKQSLTRYDSPKVIGKISSAEINESSGLVASRCQENVFWTHNDSGDNAFLYAISQKGEKLGTWKVKGAKNKDWEDIATIKNKSGECFLYIGDIGDNEKNRTDLIIYRVREPKISAENRSSGKKNPLLTENAEIINFRYPESRHDAETLLIHPETNDIYILTKRLSGSSEVYKIKGNFEITKTPIAEKIADLSVPAIPNGFLTGGEISPDGRRIVVCDYFNAYEIILPENAKNFDEIWKEKPVVIELGKREQGEAVCYSANGNSIFATSEKINSPLIEVKRIKR
jgi:hypothetical protein